MAHPPRDPQAQSARLGTDDGQDPGDKVPAPPSGEGGFEEVLAEHLLAVEAGAAPDREVFIRMHPQWASELRGFFADESQVGRLAGPPRPERPGAVAPAPTNSTVVIVACGSESALSASHVGCCRSAAAATRTNELNKGTLPAPVSLSDFYRTPAESNETMAGSLAYSATRLVIAARGPTR